MLTRSFPLHRFGLAAGVLLVASFLPALGQSVRGEAAPPPEEDVTGAFAELALAAFQEAAAEGGAPLLPPETRVERAAWSDGVLDVDLTVPLPAGTYLNDLEVEALSDAFAAVFAEHEGFRGVRIAARRSAAEPFGALTVLMQPEPEGVWDRAAPAAVEVSAFGDRAREVPYTRGPVFQSTRQPQGALSGVTVFAAAGHGWTAGDSSWFLQRPYLHQMIEDYGNIDQLNYFVHYCYNAGATVVPFRPVGWQPIEIVIDNDDPEVTFSGTWTPVADTKYYEDGTTVSSVSYRTIASAPVETATARYTPAMPATDFYPVYAFSIAGPNRTLQTYRVRHGGGVSEVSVDHRLVGNGWVWLGTYYFEAGGEAWVEITNEAAEAGLVVADAIRWGCGMGDVYRSGPDRLSGYPKDEEAARYWANSTLGQNAVGFDSYIWDIDGSPDVDDNVRTAAKWAREMNQEPANLQVDRWKRIYLEFHTNASGGAARGQITLLTTLGETTYQQEYATILSNEVDADLSEIQSLFEHSWFDRSEPTYTSAYGAICTPANGDEFDATIVELAFHDNQQDAELLRDARMREAMARACLHGIIRFLNTLPGSQVPLAFPPATPTYPRVEDLGGGDVRVSWQVPPTSNAYGDPATGYVIYESTDGYAFGAPIDVGNATTHVITGVPTGETRYFRIAATNAGGESMPTEVLAVRRPAEGTADILLVNGFDRQRRQINPLQTFTQPPGYAGITFERTIWQRSNRYDYVVQHAEALAAMDEGFATASNEAVINSHVLLGDYAIVDWILGLESVEDEALTIGERTKLEDFLLDGGAAFLSGADLVYSLAQTTGGAQYASSVLHVGLANGDADTYTAASPASGIYVGLGGFSFAPDEGAPYDVREPDALTAIGDGLACLTYTGGSNGTAAVQFTGPVYNVVTFGFPFEAVGDAAVRAELMARTIAFLREASGPLPFDYDRDGDVDQQDVNAFYFCFRGPGRVYQPGFFCLEFDANEDMDVDLHDFAELQQVFTGPLP